MRIGVKLPTDRPEEVVAFARAAEEIGYDSLWVSDHVVMPREIRSHYPFAADGRATWPARMPWFDAVVLLSMAAAVTSRLRLGVAVLVAPLRQPVVLAKQVASLAVLGGDRVTLGAGAGWLAEEYAALGVPFADRGRRLDEWLAVVRDCWSGEPAARRGRFYDLPDGVLCLPAPGRPPPVLVGGVSDAALRRAARHDGWVAHEDLRTLDVDRVAAGAARVRALATDPPRVVLRLVGSAGRAGEVARRLPALAAAGVDELVVDVAAGQARAAFELLEGER
ncbi:TIGR03619 family F420-dependent LLM class oxidoreductase [Phytohabitans suffuscus]|uniref:Luciferase-like domain-containing protein n=1 Tax=Phytohabitans suffuscus TaxID=624315 RepID=A0A6F8YUV4_9ACTN|nr:TIGR03619 family F420-dependent LLM class oxidoreductase [Phytohabitans suffuscus]BCB89621.1 hypothetical protein Psuf_069340 [Phytohabitans suffuscus]